MNKNSKKELTVIFLTKGGYKLSSFYGKILGGGMAFSTLDAAKRACKEAGMEFIVA